MVPSLDTKTSCELPKSFPKINFTGMTEIASRSASAAYQFVLQKAGVVEMTDTVEVVEALSA